jgi:hypothetical protein
MRGVVNQQTPQLREISENNSENAVCKENANAQLKRLQAKTTCGSVQFPGIDKRTPPHSQAWECGGGMMTRVVNKLTAFVRVLVRQTSRNRPAASWH